MTVLEEVEGRRPAGSAQRGAGQPAVTGRPEVARLWSGVAYPVTLLLGLQYVALALVPAALNSNPYFPFIASIVTVGLLTSFVVEHAFHRSHLQRHSASKPFRIPGRTALWTVMLVGSCAPLVEALLGGGTYSTQVGSTAASPLVSLLTPIAPWSIFGCAFALISWRAGTLSRKGVSALILVAVVLHLAVVLQTGIYAPLMNFGFTVSAGTMLVGLVRPRWLMLGLIISVLAWPILYSARTATRQVSGVPPSALVTSDQPSRFREDLLMQQAAQFGQLDVLQPSVVDIARFGLIPRFLDPGRGLFAPGFDLNIAIGGVSNSADTFTVWGTLWSLNGGYWAVVVYAASVAALLGTILRRLSPIRLSVAMLMVSQLVWIESTYPANVAGVLQGLLSLGVAAALFSVLSSFGGASTSLSRRTRRQT